MSIESQPSTQPPPSFESSKSQPQGLNLGRPSTPFQFTFNPSLNSPPLHQAPLGQPQAPLRARAPAPTTLGERSRSLPLPSLDRTLSPLYEDPPTPSPPARAPHGLVQVEERNDSKALDLLAAREDVGGHDDDEFESLGADGDSIFTGWGGGGGGIGTGSHTTVSASGRQRSRSPELDWGKIPAIVEDEDEDEGREGMQEERHPFEIWEDPIEEF
ncbi:Rfx2p [Pseudohyphozyma bogoriensis]|nr:Rfx2p [Pseudohyphozyma bogoriensis]